MLILVVLKYLKKQQTLKMYNLNLFLFAILVNGLFVEAKIQTGKNALISCQRHENCIMFMGPEATCVDHICVCQNEELCKSHETDARVRTNVIGEDCADNYNCNIQFSFCSDGYCACTQDRVVSNDGRRCLQVTGGLGQGCEDDMQCIRNISGSVCRKNTCVCDDFHHQDHNSTECSKKVGLGQACSQQSQCSSMAHAHCGQIFCECDDGFVESASRTKCLPVATQAFDKCEEREQCRQLFGHGALCMYGKCECDAVHRVANSTAYPSRLKQICLIDDECKSYKDDLTMHCDEGRCECQLPYIEQDGVCNGSTNIKSTLLTSMLLAMLLLIICFN